MRSGDFIFVKNLLVKSVSGADGWSRLLSQPAILNIAINSGKRLQRMALSDDIRRTLNYDSLSTSVLQKLETQPSPSIESTALSALKIIQSQISPGEWAEVSVAQPKALLQAKTHELTAQGDSTGASKTVVEKLGGLDLHTIIGINDLERVRLQLVTLDISIKRASGEPLFTHKVVEELAQKATDAHFLTIESFVNYVAGIVCELPITEVTVRAAKPNALNMASEAAVQVTRTPRDFKLPAPISNHTVYIAFGTNQGDRIANIRRSVTELNKRGIKVELSSSIYESNPMYFTDQPQFLNGVFKCTTDLEPLDLLEALKDIEYNSFGRVKLFDNGPRTFDLDIILYDNEFIELETLTVPHKDMLNRSFVLRPLNDLMPASLQYPLISDGEHTILPLLNSKHMTLDPYTNSRPTVMMAIMNATPDSFSDGGDLQDIQKVARKHLENGATILDVGGYSTRPGAEDVDADVEAERVCHAIREIRKVSASVAISVDTFRGSVARKAIEAGADIINDVFAGTLDPAILDVAAETGAPIILSHARGTPQTMKNLTEYPNGIIADVASELRQRIEDALAAGCQSWQLILDPGLGFAKTPEQDFELVRRFADLKSRLSDGLPRLPWLVGPSRKSFIGQLVKEPVAKNRVPGTVAVVTALRAQGADIVRVHDTHEVGQALQVADKIYASAVQA